MKSDKKKKEKFLFQKLNLLKTKVISMHYTKFSEDEIKKILILPFMQITGYEISDKNIFKINKKTDENSADYIIQKESKPIIFVKYVKIDDSIFDFKNNVYFGCKQFSDIASNLLQESKEGCVVLTNGLIYLFFNSKDLDSEIEYRDQCFFFFNLLNIEEVETEIELLNYFFTKESVFNYLEVKKNKKRKIILTISILIAVLVIIFFVLTILSII